MGSNGLSGRSWERFSQPLPSLEARLAISVFLCLCLFVVTGLETLSHREHEARAHWHSFHFFHCFSLSLSFPDWFHLGGRVGPWWEGQQSSLNLTHDLTLSRGRLGKDLSAMAWTFGFPLHMCVSCFWGGRLVPYAPLRKNSLKLVSLLRESFTISYSCHLGGRVGSRREVWQGSPLWSWRKFPRLRSFHWPFSTCVGLVLGWKGHSIRIMKQELFDIDFTSSGLHYLICLSVVAGVEGLSYKEHEAKSYWHAVHSFGCLSLCPHVAALPEAGPDILSYFFFLQGHAENWFWLPQKGTKKRNCKLDATMVYEINPEWDPQTDALHIRQSTPNIWLWDTPI